MRLGELSSAQTPYRPPPRLPLLCGASTKTRVGFVSGFMHASAPGTEGAPAPAAAAAAQPCATALLQRLERIREERQSDHAALAALRAEQAQVLRALAALPSCRMCKHFNTSANGLACTKPGRSPPWGRARCRRSKHAPASMSRWSPPACIGRDTRQYNSGSGRGSPPSRGCRTR